MRGTAVTAAAPKIRTCAVELSRARMFSAAAVHAGDAVIPQPRTAVEEHHQHLSSDVVQDMSMQSVVKVFCDLSSPVHTLPWQMRAPHMQTGSGFAIEHGGRRMILTNAHVVTDHKVVTLRKHGNPERYPATVLALGHDCDLAVLDVRNEDFWHDMQPLEFGDIPHLQDTCLLVGFPTGGDTLSITRGIVSRIEMQTYAHSQSHLLAIQVDAAVNAGNSGGPAVYNNRVMGVAFQNLAGASNVGYVIPTPIVLHFLDDLQKNDFDYKGFGLLGFGGQIMENPQMRAHFGMTPAMSGILIRTIQPHGSKLLKKNDVLLKIDGIQIANDGTVPFRQRERMNFVHLVSKYHQGETIRLEVLRDKKVLSLEAEVGPWDPLVPVRFNDKPPYFIHAGFVFSALSQQLITECYGEDWSSAPWRLVRAATELFKEKAGQEVVVVSQVLSHEVNRGYTFVPEMLHQVEKVNGEEVSHLRQMVEIVENNREDTLRIETSGDVLIVLDTAKAAAATEEILSEYQVPATKSESLRKEQK